MADLVALALEGGDEFVDAVRRVWDAGDAVFPLDLRLPRPARDRLVEAMAPAWVLRPGGDLVTRHGGRPVGEGDALVVATSGSTGAPKGVVHTHESVAASARATNAGIGTDPARDTILACLPVAHVAGFSAFARALLSGTPLVIHPSFDADAVDAAARGGATITTLVPTAIRQIDASLFRRIVVGGAAPTDPLASNCLHSYGLSETGSAICYDGRPLPGGEVRVVDGEIQVRGPMLFRCYRDGRDPKSADGWFATGDRGELSTEGVLSVHGRSDDLIISGGQNVWPVPVEAVLETHPAVAEVAVVGRVDATWGQLVTAVVVAEGAPPTLDQLRDLAKEHLPAYAAPRALELVERLPRTALGKVQRHRL